MATAAISPATTVYRADYGAHEAAMSAYRKDGEARAMALGNRGPIRYKADGTLRDDIAEAYWQHGFYVFENVIGKEELADIEHDFREILERAPTEPGGKLDRHGRPALGADGKGGSMAFVRPLSDPIGGTDRNKRPPSGEDDRADAAARRTRMGAAGRRRLAAVLRCVATPVCTSGPVAGGSRLQWR